MSLKSLPAARIGPSGVRHISIERATNEVDEGKYMYGLKFKNQRRPRINNINKERLKERKTKTERKTDRQANNKQPDRQAGRQADRQAGR